MGDNKPVDYRFYSISFLDGNDPFMMKKFKEEKEKSIFDFNNDYYDNYYQKRSSSNFDDFMSLFHILNNLFPKKSNNQEKLKNQFKRKSINSIDILKKNQLKKESILGKEPLIKSEEEAQQIIDEYTEYTEAEVK